MDIIRKNDLRTLMETKKTWCVSLYMPARKAGREKRQNPVQFKNLVNEAEGQLRQESIPGKETQKLFGPAHELLRMNDFWLYQSEGLAVFLSSGLFLTYRLPQSFEKLVVVAKRFHLKPLLPFLSRGGHFFLLALSQNEVRLFRGTRTTIKVINLDEVPKTLKEALKYDEPDTQLQFHTGTGQRRGMRSAIFHGHGAGIDDKKDDLLRYFQRIDKGLQEILADEEAPLVLASVDYYWPIFTEASSYSRICEEGVKGNPEEMDEKELHDRAWEIVQPLFADEQAESLGEYEKFQAEGKTSADLNEIVPASHQGRVAVLFAALGVQKWGIFDEEKNEVSFQEKASASNQDLLDLAAVQTLLNGGRVFALPPEKMPSEASIAAVFRY